MPKTSPIDAHVKLLGTVPDAEVAKLAGVSASAVYQYRRYRGLGVAPRSGTAKAAAAASTASTPKPSKTVRRSKLDGFVDVLGVLPDAEVGRRAGVTREAVRQYKHRRGVVSGPATKAAARGAAVPVTKPPSSGERLCWRVSIRDGGCTHLAATTAFEAAQRAQAAFGDRAVAIERLGVVFP